jgi:hypothetical protein
MLASDSSFADCHAYQIDAACLIDKVNNDEGLKHWPRCREGAPACPPHAPTILSGSPQILPHGVRSRLQEIVDQNKGTAIAEKASAELDQLMHGPIYENQMCQDPKAFPAIWARSLTTPRHKLPGLATATPDSLLA